MGIAERAAKTSVAGRRVPEPTFTYSAYNVHVVCPLVPPPNTLSMNTRSCLPRREHSGSPFRRRLCLVCRGRPTDHLDSHRRLRRVTIPHHRAGLAFILRAAGCCVARCRGVNSNRDLPQARQGDHRQARYPGTARTIFPRRSGSQTPHHTWVRTALVRWV